MKSVLLLFLTLAVFLGGAALLIGCADGDDDDDNEGDDNECIYCDSTAECTEALGVGWACNGGCCEQIVDDDVSDDDQTDDDSGDDDDGDDDQTDDDAVDDDSSEPGDVDFETEDVDRAAAGDRQTSLRAVGNTLHAAFTGCTDTACSRDELIYAVKTGVNGTWETTSVDSSNNETGWFPSLEVDSQGNIYIVYNDHQNTKVRFAYKAAKADWTTETIGPTQGGWWTSATMSGDDFIASYLRLPSLGWSNESLQVGWFSSDSWAYTDVDTTYGAGYYTSMATMPDGKPVVAYAYVPVYPTGSLMIASFNGSDWEKLSIDSSSIGHSIAIDQDGYIHLAYSKPDSGGLWDLWYATNAPAGEWSKVKLDGGEDQDDDTGGFPSIAIDDHGGIHVAYRHFSADELQYARKVGGGDWEFYTADPIGGGLYSSIDIDEAGGVHIIYEGASTIKYSYCATCAQYE